jgi:hypothetical protein
MTITTTDLTCYLKRYNEWRRGADTEPPEPSELGEVIDAACDKLEELENDKERLDWLLDEESGVNLEYVYTDKRGKYVIVWFDDREDIDKAMEEHFATER